MSIEFLQSNFEKVSYLASLLNARATGKDASDLEFESVVVNPFWPPRYKFSSTVFLSL